MKTVRFTQIIPVSNVLPNGSNLAALTGGQYTTVYGLDDEGLVWWLGITVDGKYGWTLVPNPPAPESPHA